MIVGEVRTERVSADIGELNSRDGLAVDEERRVDHMLECPPLVPGAPEDVRQIAHEVAVLIDIRNEEAIVDLLGICAIENL